MEVIEAVKHYQRSIERCPGNQERMLHCISKLYHLPVTVQHLQETGVGRTVNGLRKYEGDTGDAAKALVAKWKAMVAAEVSDTEPVAENEEPEPEVEPEPDPEPETRRESHHRSKEHRHKSSRNHHSHHNDNHHSDRKYKESSHHKSREERSSHKRRTEDSSSDGHEEKRRRKNVSESSSEDANDSDSEEMQIETEEDEGGSEEEESNNPVNEECQESQKSSDSSDEEEEEEEEEAPRKQHTHQKHDKYSQRHGGGNTSDSNSVSDHKGVKVNCKSSSVERRTEKHQKSDGDRQRKSENEKYKSEHEKHKSDKHKHRREDSQRHEKPDSDRHKMDSSDRHKKEDSDRHKKEDSDRHKKEDRNRHKKEDRDRHRKEESDKYRKDENEKHKKDAGEKHKKNSMDKSEKHKRESDDKHRREEVKIKKEPSEHRSDKNKSENIPKHGSSKSHKKSSDSKGKDSQENKVVKIKQENTGDEDGSIDCFSGASFAEALGMLDPVGKKKSRISSPTSSTHNSTHRKNESSSSSEKKSKDSKTSKSHRSVSSPLNEPGLLSSDAKLEPLDRSIEVDVDSTLPAINPNYRPLPHVPMDAPGQRRGKILTEEEALSQVMSTKNLRTKVFSGAKGKGWATVPTLYDICVRVLQENIDALEYTGGVPYDLLKPVLSHATPEQLHTLEYHNSYLIEDTDELWEKHCKKIFRNKQREELESFRDMYLRCLEEREAKLKALTTNIQQSQIAKTAPIRKTKLAYVDSVVKPPRNVARQQAKFGTGNLKASSPSKVAKAATVSSASAGGAVPVPAPSSRVTHAAKVKPRMAPLMQKTMKLAKSFKR